jgi:hypothetical protein
MVPPGIGPADPCDLDLADAPDSAIDGESRCRGLNLEAGLRPMPDASIVEGPSAEKGGGQ